MINLNSASDFAQKITIILGIFGGFTAFFQSQLDKRVERSFEMAKKLDGDQGKNFDTLLDKWASFSKNKRVFMTGTKSERDIAINNFYKDKKAESDLNSILDYFEDVRICIEEKFCDKNTILSLVRPNAKQILEISDALISNRRISLDDPSIGSGIKIVASMEKQNLFYRLNPF